jgi:protoheme IX farnesyltransferase
MAGVAVTPWVLGLVWHIYGAVAVLLSLAFIWLALGVMRDHSDKAAKRLFGFSILYLFALFVALIADKLVAGWIL